jgi:hypothetical protein
MFIKADTGVRILLRKKICGTEIWIHPPPVRIRVKLCDSSQGLFPLNVLFDDLRRHTDDQNMIRRILYNRSACANH